MDIAQNETYWRGDRTSCFLQNFTPNLFHFLSRFRHHSENGKIYRGKNNFDNKKTDTAFRPYLSFSNLFKYSDIQ